MTKDEYPFEYVKEIIIKLRTFKSRWNLKNLGEIYLRNIDDFHKDILNRNRNFIETQCKCTFVFINDDFDVSNFVNV